MDVAACIAQIDIEERALDAVSLQGEQTIGVATDRQPLNGVLREAGLGGSNGNSRYCDIAPGCEMAKGLPRRSATLAISLRTATM